MFLNELQNTVDEFFHGKYKIEKFLDSGTFGELYIIKHVFLDDLRVMKIVKEPLDSNSNINLILYEARLACQLKHENIVDIYDAGVIRISDEDNFIYFIMEYIPGGDLNQYIFSFIEYNILIPVYWVLTLIKQVSFGLSMLHSSHPPLVHGDLNPNNILLSFNSSDRVVVKLSDFGFSRKITSVNLNPVIEGTLPYMAPECFKNEYNPSTDIYALGVIFYILLTNHFPYNVDKFDLVELIDLRPWRNPLIPPSHYNDDVSSYLDEIVMKCLASNHEDRFSDANEIIIEIEKALENYSLFFDKKDYVVNNSVKKAFRLVKYEKKLSEAIEIIKDLEMVNVLEDVMSSGNFNELTDNQTIKIDNINELLNSTPKKDRCDGDFH